MQPAPPIDLDRFERALEGLHAVARSILVPQDELSLYRTLFEQLRQIVQFDAGYVLRYYADLDQMEDVYFVDEGIEDTETRPWDYRSSPAITWIVEHRLPLVFGNFGDEIHQLFPGIQIQAFGNVRKSSASWMSVPLLLGERLVGILNLQSYQPSIYHGFELYIVRTLSNTVGVAMENARLLKRLQQAIAGVEIRLVPLSATGVVLPITTLFDGPRWALFIERVLLLIASQAARQVALDVSNLDDLDAASIRPILQLCDALVSRGYRPIITGIPSYVREYIESEGALLHPCATDVVSGLRLLAAPADVAG